MSLSIFSSKAGRFGLWVLVFYLGSFGLIGSLHWGGETQSAREHEAAAKSAGAAADYLILGDSTVGAFSNRGVNEMIPGYRGLAFTSDSVTPVYYYYVLKRIRAETVLFAPKVVFLVVGANNFNVNGLHAQRDFAFNNLLPLADLWQLGKDDPDKLRMVEALLGRAFPVYGYRVPITHLYFSFHEYSLACADTDQRLSRWPDRVEFEPGVRNHYADRNYLDIYKRSMYKQYENSETMAAGVRAMIKMVRAWGGVPILVSLPLTREMYALYEQLVGDNFVRAMQKISASEQVEWLYLYQHHNYDFMDVNHLSAKGAYDVTQEWLAPRVRKYVGAPFSPASQLAPKRGAAN